MRVNCRRQAIAQPHIHLPDVAANVNAEQKWNARRQNKKWSWCTRKMYDGADKWNKMCVVIRLLVTQWYFTGIPFVKKIISYGIMTPTDSSLHNTLNFKSSNYKLIRWLDGEVKKLLPFWKIDFKSVEILSNAIYFYLGHIFGQFWYFYGSKRFCQ